MLFPASDAPVQHLEGDPPQAPAWRGSGTILIADDEETVRKVGSQMLEHLGFQTLRAADGQQALSSFLLHRDSIVFVIVDLTMPAMDGEETFREIHKVDPPSPRHPVQRLQQQDAVQRFVGKGLAGFLQKPYQLAQLRQKLKEIVEDAPGSSASDGLEIRLPHPAENPEVAPHDQLHPAVSHAAWDERQYPREAPPRRAQPSQENRRDCPARMQRSWARRSGPPAGRAPNAGALAEVRHDSRRVMARAGRLGIIHDHARGRRPEVI